MVGARGSGEYARCLQLSVATYCAYFLQECQIEHFVAEGHKHLQYIYIVHLPYQVIPDCPRRRRHMPRNK